MVGQDAVHKEGLDGDIGVLRRTAASVCMSTYKAAVEGAEHKRVPDDVAEHPTIVGHEFCGDIVPMGPTDASRASLPPSLMPISWT